jgi:hypothetical protein
MPNSDPEHAGNHPVQAMLTWSGSVSHAMASFFRVWLHKVLPGIQPWISNHDIAKGKLWFQELTSQLIKTNVSISFITPENILSPWVYFESGAISVKIKHSLICPYLVGVTAAKVRDTPLGQFQFTEANREETWNLVRSINRLFGDSALDEEVLEENFNTAWPELEGHIQQVLQGVAPITDPVVEVQPPSEPQLSEYAEQLLLKASLDGECEIYVNNYDIKINKNNQILTDGTARLWLYFNEAIGDLIKAGLLEKGRDYDADFTSSVTIKGYKLADLIRSRNSSKNS